MALPTDIRLGRKGFPGINSLAYYKNPYITAAKSFIVQGPGHLGPVVLKILRIRNIQTVKASVFVCPSLCVCLSQNTLAYYKNP